MINTDYDIVICGGGMIGAGLASVLAQQSLSIAVIEPELPKAFFISQPFDLRVSALLPVAQKVLKRTQAWQHILSMRATPLRHMRVWEQAEVGDVSFSAHEMHTDYLGYIVENRVTQIALWQVLQHCQNVTLVSAAKPTQISRQNDVTTITLDSGKSIRGKLVVAADGGESFVRQQLGIGVHRYRYQQACLVASVNTELGQQDITWQRFVPTGPQAFLPLPGQHGSIVWYHHTDEINRLAQLSNKDLSDVIMAAFPAQLGAIEVVAKGHFPLQKMHAFDYVQEGLVLIGDAAHMINPLAGQGVNLGFRDIACLDKIISQALSEGQAWWSEAVLQAYQQQRRPDNRLMMEAMNCLYHSFSNDYPGIKWLRNRALSMAQWQPIKRPVMAYAMGLENNLEGDLTKISNSIAQMTNNLQNLTSVKRTFTSKLSDKLGQLFL